MSEQSTTTSVKRRKKTSRTLFAYTGKGYTVKSKEHLDGLHPAAVAWIEVIKEAGKPMDRDECLAALASKETATKQPLIRIIYYWKKFLVDGGWLTMSKKEQKAKAVAVPVPEAVAPVEAAEATA